MARTLAKTIAEGRRLIAANKGKHGYCTMDPGPHAALRMLPALLDVAEAAAAYQEEMAALGNGVDPALSAALSALGLVTDGEGKEKSNG